MTQTQTFELNATAGYVAANLTVATAEQAAEIAANFPKSAKVRATTLTTWRAGEHQVLGLVTFQAGLAANGVNGGRNETGIKRYQSFRRTAEKLGYGFEFVTPYSNSLTEAEFAAAVTP